MVDQDTTYAIATDDIKTISQLKARGVSFVCSTSLLSGVPERLGDHMKMMRRI
jgi:hypothetical protein